MLNPTPAAALEVERHAKSGVSWEDVLSAASEAESDDRAAPAQQALLLQMARWYETKLARPDLALPYYSKVLGGNPTHDGALDGVANVYRKAQQWSELASALLVRADAPQTAASQARDLRVEAAELLENKLGARTPRASSTSACSRTIRRTRRPARLSSTCTRRPATSPAS